MDFIGEPYYKLNKISLTFLGLWPYQTSTLKKMQIIFFQTLFISFLICQCNTIFVKKYRGIKSIIKILFFIDMNFIYLIKYNACLLLADNIKYIFDRIRHDWNMLKAQTELEVIRKYAGDAKLYTIYFFFLVISCSLGFVVIIYLPNILNVIIPINESRPLQTIIRPEYFVDDETYFIVIFAHILAAQSAGCITVASTGTICIAYAMHTSAMFKIASHRLEHLFDEKIQQMPKDIKRYILYNKLMHAVHVHRRAIDLANILTNSFATMYFVLLGTAVISMSLCFFNFVNAVISLNEIELLMFGSAIFLHLYYVFLGNYVGQNIIDNSIEICQATYNAQWYNMPLWMQKLILIIMQRSNKKSSLTAGGLFDASLEGFAMLMSTSLSYVMVLQSVGGHKEIHKNDNSHV